MKHELKVTDSTGETLPQDFGVSEDAFESMVDNLSLELHHATIFKKDNRTLSKCLLDAIDNLDPDEFGLELKTANDYLILGMAYAKAIELREAMMDGVKARARDKGGDILSSLMRRMSEREENKPSFKTTGSVN